MASRLREGGVFALDEAIDTEEYVKNLTQRQKVELLRVLAANLSYDHRFIAANLSYDDTVLVDDGYLFDQVRNSMVIIVVLSHHSVTLQE